MHVISTPVGSYFFGVDLVKKKKKKKSTCKFPVGESELSCDCYTADELHH